jgi:hypothetical protein
MSTRSASFCFRSGTGRSRSLLVAIALLLLSLQTGFAAPAARRIRFKPGATNARLRGRLKGVDDEAYFVLHAHAGQHMAVKIRGDGATRGIVYFPSGRQDGQPGGLIFDGDLDETGDYRILVEESKMADEWKGSFVLEVTIR